MGRYQYYELGSWPINHRMGGIRKKWYYKENPVSVWRDPTEPGGYGYETRVTGFAHPHGGGQLNSRANRYDVLRDYIGRRWVMPIKKRLRNRQLYLGNVVENAVMPLRRRASNVEKWLANDDWQRELISYIG